MPELILTTLLATCVVGAVRTWRIVREEER